jgi:hypothetical protein
MVQKLQMSEYLNRYDNMTTGERRLYEKRVGEWLEKKAPVLAAKTEDFDARLQNVMQVSTGWNDQECQAFSDGAVLLSALIGTGETWLPDMLYVKAAKRAIMNMTELLRTKVVQPEEVQNAPAADATPAKEPAKAELTDTGSFRKADDLCHIAGGDHEGEAQVKAAPVRPKHIDQYVHLLPKKTQERAAQVKDLLQELDGARQKMSLLMDDPTAKSDDREAWAKKATSIDNKIRAIYGELDSEWDKLVRQGRVVVDDLGNARVLPAAEGEDGQAAEEEATDLSSEQKARRRELRKWLVDTRRGNGDSRQEHVEKWKENFREFLSFDGEAAFQDQKLLEAAAHYGIDLKEFGMKQEDTPAEAQEDTTDAEPSAEEQPSETEQPAEEEQPTDAGKAETEAEKAEAEQPAEEPKAEKKPAARKTTKKTTKK